MQTEGALRVDVQNGNMVGLYAEDRDAPADSPDRYFGFILGQGVAVDAATKLLRTVAELAGDNTPAQPIDSVAVDHRTLDDGEDVARLTFSVQGAPLAVYLDLTQLAELTAALAVVSRKLDEPRR
ncbi:hypothetical protein [Sphingomonas sp. YL-JM2C]